MPRKTKEVEPKSPAQLVNMLNKKFGPGTVTTGSDPSLNIIRLPTGVLSVDYLTQGGFARGRHHELYGSANVGKTALTYYFIAESQRVGLNCAFFDVERTYDPVFAESLGVDTKKLSFKRQDLHGNELINIMEVMLRSGVYDVIVLDSIAALLPKAEADKDMEAGSYGTQQAKLMSAALRRLTAANKDTVLVYINQTRDNIGSVFAAQQMTSGGRAMGFYAGMRIELVRTQNIKRKGLAIDPATGKEVTKDIVVGHRVLLKVNKNKTGGVSPSSQGTFVFDYELEGIDPIEDMLYIGRDTGWIHTSGDTWWLEGFEEEKKNGRTRFKKWLASDQEAQETLLEWINNIDWSEDA